MPYLIEEAGFDPEERTRGPLGLSLLHCAAYTGAFVQDAATEVRQLAVLRYLIEQRPPPSVVEDLEGLLPSDYVTATVDGTAPPALFALDAAETAAHGNGSAEAPGAVEAARAWRARTEAARRSWREAMAES